MGYLVAGPGIEEFNVFCCRSDPNLVGLQMVNFDNLRIITKSWVKNVHKEKVPNHQVGWAEYPAVHLKEAILIPIVLLALVARCSVV